MAPLDGEECNVIAKVTNPVGPHLNVFLRLSRDLPVIYFFVYFF